MDCERGVLLIVGRGRNRFGYCYSGDLSQAVELTLRREGIEGNAYTVTNRELPNWMAFLTALQNGLGRAQRAYVPEWRFVIYETACSLLYHIAWEFLFRGVLFFPLVPLVGLVPALAVQTIASTLYHYGHTASEVFAAAA